MTPIEQADQLFSKTGFWQRIVPATLSHCMLYVSVAYFSVGRNRDIQGFVWIAAAVICFVAFVYFLRYAFAAQRHRELKSRFGEEYFELIKSGKIFINTSSVLMLGAPLSLARRYLKADDL